jgi:hypothetical protein
MKWKFFVSIRYPPLFYINALKTSNTHYSFSYSVVPCNTHRREIEQHDHAFNMKVFHPSELGHPANTSQILSLHTPHISTPSHQKRLEEWWTKIWAY